jgi:hypothetical protein
MLRAPRQELVSLQRPRHNAPACAIHRVHVHHLLGDIHTYPNHQTTCNLGHGASPLQLQIDFSHTVNLGASTPVMDWGSPFIFAQPDPLRHAAIWARKA